MKITSFANSSFPIDGVQIIPGTRDYKKLDASKREVKYQLGILKAEGTIDFKELIPARPHRLPFVEKKQGLKEDAEDLKKEQKKPEVKKDVKPDVEKPDSGSKKSRKG